MKSNWLLNDKPEEGFGDGWRAVRSHKGEERGYHPIILQLCWNLGIKSPEHAENFLNPKYENLGNPFLFSGMERAIERIFISRETGEKVFVYADYDADGVTGAVILETILRACGIGPGIYIPHREKEGYGLNRGAIDHMCKQGGKLVITCDCGVSNNEEIAYAKSKGLDVIVTDHHALPAELSKDAYAIIHPDAGEYPFKALSGGGVAFKLAQGILKSGYKIMAEKSREQIEKWMLDLVAISTVGDVMPLIGENRILVKYGLFVLNQTRRAGLKKLIEAAGLEPGKLDAYSIAFQIAPRINAAGRLDHANTAYELLVENDEARAEHLALELNKKNGERQKQTDLIVQEAKYQIVEKGIEEEYCLFVFGPEWPLGLLGLAASQLVKIFNRPAVLLTEIGGDIKGSARGIEQFNIMDALRKSEKLFIRYGGHPMAAGMSLKKENLGKFEKKMLKLAKEALQDQELAPVVRVNEAEIDEITLEIAEEIKKFEPFGNQNPRPLFLSREVEVRGVETMGNGEKHLRINVSGSSGKQHKMVGFCFERFCEILPKVGEKYDIVYEAGINEWNGSREAQLKIVDMDRRNKK